MALFCWAACFAGDPGILIPSIYPVRLQNNTYNLNESFPGGMLFKFTGDRKKLNGKKLTLILEVPEPVKYIISCGYMPSKIAQYAEFSPDKSTFSQNEKNGKKYNRYEIVIDPAICSRIADKPAWNNFDRLYLEADKGSAGFSGDVFWEFLVGSESCAKGSFLINVLPPLKIPEKSCSHFGLTVARLASLTVPDKNVSDAYTNYWKSLQARPMIFNPPCYSKYSPEILKTISDNFDLGYMEAGARGALPYFLLSRSEYRENVFPALIDSEGKKVPSPGKAGLISPWYLAEDPDGIIWEKEFSRYSDIIKKSPVKIKAIVWDVEPGAKNDCFSEKNRERFRDFAKLDHLPSIDEIRAKYGKEWFGFRVSQNSMIIANFSKAMRKYLPDVKFMLCSDPVHAGDNTVSEWCGVDIRLSDNDIDTHMHMPYYSGLRFYNDLKFNLEVLKKPYFPLIDPAEDMEYFYSQYTPEKVGQNIIAAAALGCEGIGFWPEDIFDGRYLTAISSAYSQLTYAEDFYYSKRCKKETYKWEAVNVSKTNIENSDGSALTMEIPDFAENVKTIMHENNGKYLITLLNYDSANAAIIKFSIPGLPPSDYVVKDIKTEEIYMEGKNNLSVETIRNGFLIEIPPDGIKLISVTRTDCLSQESLKEKLKEAISKIGSQADIYRKKESGALKIEWGAIKGNQTQVPVLKMKAARRTLIIDSRKGADIIGWQDNENTRDDILFCRGRGFLGRLAFYDNSQEAAPYDFKLESTSFDNNRSVAVFKYRMPPYPGANPVPNPMEGLEITKTVSFPEDGNGCTIKFDFLNNNRLKNKITFGFRISSYPRLGSAFAGNKNISDISWIEFSGSDGKKEKLKNDGTINNVILRPDVKISFDMKQNREKNWNGDKITIFAENWKKHAALSLDMTLGAAGFYVWRSLKDYTVEILSEDISLDFGKTASFTFNTALSK